jgi:hypothetical protein
MEAMAAMAAAQLSFGMHSLCYRRSMPPRLCRASSIEAAIKICRGRNDAENRNLNDVVVVLVDSSDTSSPRQ